MDRFVEQTCKIYSHSSQSSLNYKRRKHGSSYIELFRFLNVDVGDRFF